MSRWNDAEAEFYGKTLPQFVRQPKRVPQVPVRELTDDGHGQYGLSSLGDEAEDD